MSEDYISVVVPVYKVENYLCKCVDSLLAQTYTSMEIILVDDGSPDNCPSICDNYASQNEKVRALHKTNGGLSSARNYGVMHAAGDWIVFVDSDDYVSESYIQDLVELREHYQADMAITRIVKSDEKGCHYQAPMAFSSYCTDARNALLEVYARQRIGWEAYGKIYSREVLIKYPFPNGYYEDCAIMYRIIMNAKKIAIGCFENNYYYITRQGSILNSQLNQKHLHIFTICDEFAEFVNTLDYDMQFLKTIMYQRAVVQMLNLQTMNNEEFKSIFLRYRREFRSSLFQVLTNSNCSWKMKIYRLFLCSTPSLYRRFTSIIQRTH